MAHQDSGIAMHRRLERHRRVDGALQARARPVTHQRQEIRREYALAKDRPSAAMLIRDFVEKSDAAGRDMASLGKRLVPGIFGGSDSGDGNDDSSSSRGGSSNSKSGGSDDDGNESSSSSSNSSNSSSRGGSSSGGRTSPTSSSDSSDSAGDSSTSSNSSSSTEDSEYDTSSSTSSSRTSSQSSSSKSHSSTKDSSPSTSTTEMGTTTRTATPTSSSSSSMSPTTSIAYVTSSAAPTSNAGLGPASATPSAQSSDDGPGAGLIIGIVAGSLAGIAVIGVIIGFLVKKFGRKDDAYDTDPFDAGAFRRHSTMIPDTFAGGEDDYQPSMSEMQEGHGPHAYTSADEYGNMDAYGMAGAGAAGAAAYGGRERGGGDLPGPRPPTMFQQHMNHQATYGGASTDRDHDQGGEYDDVVPPMPPMSYGGLDPFSSAGRGHYQQHDNVSNPYGFLDRAQSTSQSQFGHAPTPSAYANLDRSGSDASSLDRQARLPDFPQHMSSGPLRDSAPRSHGYDHDTAGRPGTAEGRSGTPDLPNVQQTYALRQGTPDVGEHPRRLSLGGAIGGGLGGFGSPTHMLSSPQHLSDDMNGVEGSAAMYGASHAQPLQIRNLLPHGRDPDGQAEPTSNADAEQRSNDAAYAGYL